MNKVNIKDSQNFITSKYHIENATVFSITQAFMSTSAAKC